MDRRIVIPTSLLVLAVSAFTGVGMYHMAAQPALVAAASLQTPSPAASPAPEVVHAAGALMSGDFADRAVS